MIIQQIVKLGILTSIGVMFLFMWIWLFYKSLKLKQRLWLLSLVMMVIVSFIGVVTSFVLGLIVVPTIEGTTGIKGILIGSFIVIAMILFLVNLVFFLLSVMLLKDYFFEK